MMFTATAPALLKNIASELGKSKTESEETTAVIIPKVFRKFAQLTDNPIEDEGKKAYQKSSYKSFIED